MAHLDIGPKVPSDQPTPDPIAVEALRARLRRRGHELLRLAAELPANLPADRPLLVDLAIDRVRDAAAQVRAAALMPPPTQSEQPPSPDERPLTSGFAQEVE